MSSRTLLTPVDVVEYTGTDIDLSTCTFRHLYNVELQEARKCIGVDFWKALVAAQADYSAVAEFVNGTTYVIGDVVKYQGVYKVALATTTAVPSVSTDWENAPKFTGDCATLYETLYCDFLAPYLAAKVLVNRLPYIWTKISDKGVVQFAGGQFETVDSKEYDRLLTAIYRDANMTWANLRDYMNDNKEEDCFALWPEFEDTTCGCGKRTCKKCGNTKVGRYEFG